MQAEIWSIDTMNVWFVMLLALIEGVVLGVIYFGDLWLTTQHSVETKEAGLLKTLGLSVRLSVVLSGFYVILWLSDWQGFLVCFAGFLGTWVALRSWVPDAGRA